MHYESLSAGDSSPCADSIIAYTLAARIKDISTQRGVGLIPSAAFGTAHLWDRFAFRVHKTLVEINSDMMLAASLGRNKIFNKIHALVGTEVGSIPAIRRTITILTRMIAHASISRLEGSHEWLLRPPADVWRY